MNSSERKGNYDKDDKKRPKPSATFDKKSHKKQGKMDPKDPFAKVVIYESSEGEVEGLEVSSFEDGVTYIDASNAVNDNTDENVLMTAIINKAESAAAQDEGEEEPAVAGV